MPQRHEEEVVERRSVLDESLAVSPPLKVCFVQAREQPGRHRPMRQRKGDGVDAEHPNPVVRPKSFHLAAVAIPSLDDRTGNLLDRSREVDADNVHAGEFVRLFAKIALCPPVVGPLVGFFGEASQRLGRCSQQTLHDAPIFRSRRAFVSTDKDTTFRGDTSNKSDCGDRPSPLQPLRAPHTPLPKAGCRRRPPLADSTSPLAAPHRAARTLALASSTSVPRSLTICGSRSDTPPPVRPGPVPYTDRPAAGRRETTLPRPRPNRTFPVSADRESLRGAPPPRRARPGGAAPAPAAASPARCPVSPPAPVVSGDGPRPAIPHRCSDHRGSSAPCANNTPSQSPCRSAPAGGAGRRASPSSNTDLCARANPCPCCCIAAPGR